MTVKKSFIKSITKPIIINVLKFISFTLYLADNLFQYSPLSISATGPTVICIGPSTDTFPSTYNNSVCEIIDDSGSFIQNSSALVINKDKGIYSN